MQAKDLLPNLSWLRLRKSLSLKKRMKKLKKWTKKLRPPRRTNISRAITTILTACSKHQVLEAFKWEEVDYDEDWTRPAEFWEALTEVAPKLQHLSFGFYAHELRRMHETGISVRGGSFKSLLWF
jgi:hypothetical protein